MELELGDSASREVRWRAERGKRRCSLRGGIAVMLLCTVGGGAGRVVLVVDVILLHLAFEAVARVERASGGFSQIGGRPLE